MTKRLVDVDEMTGVRTWHEYDDLSDTTIIHTDQIGVDEMLARNKVLQNAGSEHFKHDKEFWHAAHVPNSVIHKWFVEEGIDFYNPDHWNAVKRKLNSSEYAFLRTGLFNL